MLFLRCLYSNVSWLELTQSLLSASKQLVFVFRLNFPANGSVPSYFLWCILTSCASVYILQRLMWFIKSVNIICGCLSTLTAFVSRSNVLSCNMKLSLEYPQCSMWHRQSTFDNLRKCITLPYMQAVRPSSTPHARGSHPAEKVPPYSGTEGHGRSLVSRFAYSWCRITLVCVPNIRRSREAETLYGDWFASGDDAAGNLATATVFGDRLYYSHKEPSSSLSQWRFWKQRCFSCDRSFNIHKTGEVKAAFYFCMWMVAFVFGIVSFCLVRIRRAKGSILQW